MSRSSDNTNYFKGYFNQPRIITLPGGNTVLSRIVLDVKCKELFLTTPGAQGNTVAYQVFAELTGIDTAQMIKINVADWPGVTSS